MLTVGRLYRIDNTGRPGPQAEMLDDQANWRVIYEHNVVLVIEVCERGGQTDSYRLLVGETMGTLYIDEFSYDLEWVEVKEENE